MSSRPSILVIEDDQGIRESIDQLLSLEGYRVYTAADGEEGLRVLDSIPHPCLVLLDIMMPVMNGHEFLKRLRSDVKVASLPVIVMTASDQQPKVEEVLKKPLDLNVLLQLVRYYASDGG